MGKRKTRARPAKTEAPAGEDEGPTAHPLLSAVLHCCGDLHRDQATICRLLCTSKTAAAAVAASCSGQLCVNLDPPDRNSTPSTPMPVAARCSSQAAWLQPNGRLLRELRCTYTASETYPAKPALLELLPALSSSAPHLAKLVGCIDMGVFSSAAAARAAAGSLGRLTTLTSLQLVIRGAQSKGGPAPFLSALQSLPSLGECHLGFVGTGPSFMGPHAAGLQHLPTQLTSLGLGVRPGMHSNSLEDFIAEAGVGEVHAMLSEGDMFGGMFGGPAGGPQGIDTSAMFGPLYPKQVPPMLLGHLTGLKELRPIDKSLPAAWAAELDIRTGDVLPPSLTNLELHADRRDLGGLLVGPLAAPTVAPLLPLKQLQVLTIRHSTASADQLQQVSAALTALTAVSLSYDSLETAAAVAPAWISLPMAALKVVNESPWYLQQEEEGEEGALPDPVGAVLGAAAGLNNLTSLMLSGGFWDATQQQLAAVLAGLTNLQELSLSGCIKPDEPPPKPKQPPRKQRGKKKAAAADGAAATAAAGPDASPAALASAITALPSLRHLSIQSESHGRYARQDANRGAPFLVDAAAALAAGANTQQLTFLQLSGLSDAGVELLAGQLTGLQVWKFQACLDVTAASLPALEGLAAAGVLREVRWYELGLTQEAAAAAGISQRLEAVSVW